MRPRPTPPDDGITDPSTAWTEFRLEELRWLQELAEHPHVKEVMSIPGDEPIFVLRSQDIYSTNNVDGWIAVASRTISKEKFKSAATRLREMIEWQNVEPTRAKIPD
jgi:hypothetical protein